MEPETQGNGEEVQPVGVAPTGTEAKIRAAIDAWRAKLLDLTMRNRLLNFRTTKVSTITIVDEQPAEVFRRLLLQDLPMKFKPAPEGGFAPARTEPADVEVEELGDEVATAPQAALDFVPYAPETLAAHHLDDELQTTSPPARLDASLLRIDTQARTTLEEQGVNTLFLTLGMVHYKEASQSEVTRKAPLVLLPVTLERKSARSGFTVRASGDDPLVNPGLVELFRRELRVRLPELPPSDEMDASYDLQTLFEGAQAALAAQPDWRVTNEIYLGLFSFQKFVMYKDLESHAAQLAGHRLIEQIVTRRGGGHQGLPEDVRSIRLDDEFPPEATAQVIDADSSQLRALIAADRGYDLVMEGPPGTGKSQTITNLVAQALSRGKSVLFVAEKMAALQVVASRLEAVGLGEFCLQLHSSKASKKSVLGQIAASLDASLAKPAVPDRARRSLPRTRAEISAYVAAVHAPFGALGRAPYFAYGELEKVANAPKVRLNFDPDRVTDAERELAVNRLKELAAAESSVAPFLEHPFLGSGRLYYTQDQREAVRDEAEAVAGLCAQLGALAWECESGLGLPPIRTSADVDLAREFAGVLASSPGAPLEVLGSEAWNAPPADAQLLISTGRRIRSLFGEVRTALREEVVDYDPTDDLALIERKLAGRASWLAWLDSGYRAAAKRWKRFRLPSSSVWVRALIEPMRQVVELRATRQQLSASDTSGRGLFGAHWRGEASNWDALELYVAWVVDFRARMVRHGLSARAQELAATGPADTSRVNELVATHRRLLDRIEALRQALEAPPEFLARATFEEISERASLLFTRWQEGPRWGAFLGALMSARETLASDAVEPAWRGEVLFQDLPRAFERAFWLRWLEAVLEQRAELRRFNAMTHEQRLHEFRDLDCQVLLENRSALIARLREESQERLRRPQAEAAMPALRRELNRQRGHKPVRRTLREAGPAIHAVCRCFMMSPLTVAQFLDGSGPMFDLVVFDEASQLPTEDAVGAIFRGKQLVVVGDPKQLPPTNFFAVATDPATAPKDEEGNPLVEDTESVLEEFMSTGAPQARLKWHYRSTDESLIAYSNVKFYDSELMTFPSVWRDGSGHGLHFEYVPDGLYEGKGVNWTEARRVADAIVQHARHHPHLSLGVGTFSINQQYALLDLLEERRRLEPDIESFFSAREQDGFFVKNLENIQGDERDVIFLSVAYAKGRDGRLRYNFGPLNQENGWRRLNVLVTRAKKQMRVFSSVRCDDFRLEATASKGARLLQEFLAYAERRRLDGLKIDAVAALESAFEAEVHAELSRRGLQLVPQVGASGYRIDLGVVDDTVPGRFVCGIECDGASYHRSESARDRDRLREQVLRDRGWAIHRIWSTDWFKDRNGQIDRILRLVEQSREEVLAAPLLDEEPRDEAPGPGGEDETDQERGLPPPPPPPIRLRAKPYQFPQGDLSWMRRDLLSAVESEVRRAVLTVAEAEAPIHVDELLSRVAALWGTRAKSRISSKILESLASAVRSGQLEERGRFVWVPGRQVVVRSRAEIQNPPADHIAPEEYQEAVRWVLRNHVALPRPELVTEVRALLGFARTGAKLEAEISTAIGVLLASGEAGEGSRGVALREREPAN